MIFNSIYNFFSRKKSHDKLTFNISMCYDDLDTSFMNSDKSEGDAIKIATMIYALNNGLLFDSIIDSLLKMHKNSDASHKFINTILVRLNGFYTQHPDDKPIINPLETFKTNHVKQ